MEKKRISKWTITFFVMVFILLPAGLLAYEPITSHFKDPMIIKRALVDAQDTDKYQIKENQSKISEIQEKAGIKSRAAEPTSGSNMVQQNSDASNPVDTYSLKNDQMKELYDDTGITYDFGQVHGIEYIPVSTEINRNLLRGQVAIPSVGLNLPVLEGVSNENLYVGASTMKPNQTMGEGNFAVAGHLMPDPDTLFSPLMRLNSGEKIYLTDKDKVYVYKVTHIGYITPQQVDVVEDIPGKKLITMITCSDLQGTARLEVRGELSATASINEVEQSIYDLFQR